MKPRSSEQFKTFQQEEDVRMTSITGDTYYLR